MNQNGHQLQVRALVPCIDIGILDKRFTLYNLERRLVSWVYTLGRLDFLVESLANALRNGRAIDFGGRHCDWTSGEGPGRIGGIELRVT